MRFDPGKLLELLKEVAEKVNGGKLDRPGCLDMAVAINEDLKAKKKKITMGYKYIYNLHNSVRDAIEEDSEVKPKPHPSWINVIAEFAGYKSYDDFISSTTEAYRALQGYIGNWYSYVRCNSGSKEVLVSPVRIYEENGQVWMELKGPVRTFKGELKLKEDCLVCLLEGNESKVLHLVFKAGFAVKPNVLQGVFSGMSTGGDPIAGREVLVRQHEHNFSNLKNARLDIPRILMSSKLEERSIGEYFKDQSVSSVKTGRTSTFELTDLLSP